MTSKEQIMLRSWIGGSLDRLVRKDSEPRLSASVDSIRPASLASPVTIVKWRVHARESALLTGWQETRRLA
jgi:hypothetical protein